jgi:hypothetical protein
MATSGQWILVNSALTDIATGVLDLDTDTFKCALFLSTSNIGPTSTTFAGLTNEVGITNTGYAAGGVAVTLTLTGTTSLKVSVSSDPQWTAGSAGLTARFAVIYEVGGRVLAYHLLDSTPADVTASSGKVLTDSIAAAGIFSWN